MAVSRYLFARRSSEFTGPSNASFIIRRATVSGLLDSTVAIIKEGERLDQIAARAYGDPGYWWVIAAASGIGWGMQVPPGVVVKIPTDISAVLSLMV